MKTLNNCTHRNHEVFTEGKKVTKSSNTTFVNMIKTQNIETMKVFVRLRYREDPIRAVTTCCIYRSIFSMKHLIKIFSFASIAKPLDL